MRRITVVVVLRMMTMMLTKMKTYCLLPGME